MDIANQVGESREATRAIDEDIAARAVAGEKIDAWSIRRWTEIHHRHEKLCKMLDEQILLDMLDKQVKQDKAERSAYSVPVDPADTTQCESCQ